MSLNQTPPTEATPVALTLTELSKRLPSPALGFGPAKIVASVYAASLGALVVGAVLMAVARKLGAAAGAVPGWTGAILVWGGIGGLAVLFIGGCVMTVHYLIRGLQLRLRRLDEIYDEEGPLIVALSVHEARDLARRGRYAKLWGQSLERMAGAVSIFGVAATQLGPMMKAWGDSHFWADGYQAYQFLPAGAALGVCFGALLLLGAALPLNRMARLYEEAAAQAAPHP